MKKQITIVWLSTLSLAASAQELEPRVYANLPKRTNAIALIYGLSRGNVLTDPSLPIEGFKVTANTFGFGYVRTFGLANRLARIQVTMPFTFLSGKLKLNGHDTSGARTGFGDMRLRFGINLLGSPALDIRNFRSYQQKTIFGISFVVALPTGLYYKDKRINLGSNRWGFKPEIGISRRFKRVYAEAYTGIWLYTKNNEFLATKTLEQEPVFSIQAHANYVFKNGMWAGVNGNWFSGGQTIIDAKPSGELANNSRLGATWSVPVSPKHSLKLQFHVGTFTNAGYDYNIILIGYQYVFF